MHNHTVKREFVTCDHVRYIEHTAQDLVLYIGHKSSQLAEGKCHTHHTSQEAKPEALKVIYRQMCLVLKEVQKCKHK